MKVKVLMVRDNFSSFYPSDTYTVVRSDEHRTLVETDTGARQWVGNSFLTDVNGQPFDWKIAPALDSGTGGQEPDGSEAAAIEIADAVLAWMVKHDFLDADAEYRDDDVIEVLNDLNVSPQPKAATEEMIRTAKASVIGCPFNDEQIRRMLTAALSKEQSDGE